MIYDFNSDASQISIQNQGGKFFYLYQLNKLKTLKIPEAICITEANYDRQQLKAWLDDSKTYAVRSSANQEDLKGRSAAGVFESFLNLSGPDAILEAIERCFLSVNSEKVKFYLKKIGISANQLRMNVIVQEMIQAEKSGVVFTVNPVNGKDELYIQTVDGVGEKLVSGQVNPTTAIFKKDNPPADELYKELWRVSILIEKTFQSAQDIEWAWKGNQLYILQARPLGLRPKSYPPEQVWTRANIGEIIPKPLTPLSWDIFREVLFGAYRIKYYSLIDRFFTNIIHLIPRKAPAVVSPKMFSGYLFLNLDTILRNFGREPWVTKEVLQAGLGFTIPDQTRAVRMNIFDRASIFIKKIIFIIELLIPRSSMEFRVQKFIRKQIRKMFGGESSDSLENMIKKVQFLFGWHIAVSARSFSHLGLLLHLSHKREHKSVTLNSVISSLSQTQAHSYLQDFELLTLDAINSEEFLKKFGHRSINEFELSQPAWIDQPELLKTFLKTGKKTVHRKNQENIKQFGMIKKVAERLRASIDLREELKSELIRYYREIRQYYLNIAEELIRNGIIERVDDIFFLKKEEVSVLMQRKTTINPAMPSRKAEYKKFLAQKVPHSFYGTDLSFQDNLELPRLRGYQGIGCSEGIVLGKVFIASSYEEATQVDDDCIVLTKSADPGWTPVLLNAKGMVAEVGGILSHIATIARENNIPLIVGIENITELLHDGQEITIDGSSGKLSVLSN